MNKWYEGLTLRNQKKITTKGVFLKKLYENFKEKTKNPVTKADVADKMQLTPQRLNAFFTGTFEDIPDDSVASLLAILQMPISAFTDLAKKTAIPGLGILGDAGLTFAKPTPPTPPTPPAPPATPAPPANPAKPDKPTKPATQTTQATPAKPTPPAKSTTRVIDVSNYTFDPLVLVIHRDGSMDIHPAHKVPKITATDKLVYVLSAAEFGNTLVPGKGNPGK